MPGFYQQYNEVNTRRQEAYEGVPLHGNRYETRDAINANPVLAHIITFTPTFAAAEETYGYTIASVANPTEAHTFSVTTTSAATTAALAAAETVAAHNADPIASSYAEATVSGDDVVLTAWFAGADSQFQLTSLVLGTQATTATGADPTAIPFGRAVIFTDAPSPGGALSASQATSISDEFCALPSVASPLNYAWTLGGYTGNEVIVVTVDFGEKSYVFQNDADTADLETALDEISARIDSVSGLTATNTATVLSISTDEDGAYLKTQVAALDADATSLTVAETSANDFLHYGNTLLGVSIYTQDTDNDALGVATTEYRAGEGVKIVSRGSVYVAQTTSVQRGNRVWIDEDGVFYTAAASGRTQIPLSRAMYRGPANNGLGIIDLL